MDVSSIVKDFICETQRAVHRPGRAYLQPTLNDNFLFIYKIYIFGRI
jgi:hypothetical protein